MALKSIKWEANEFRADDFDPYEVLNPSSPDESEYDLSDSEDGASILWPCGDFSKDVPPAPGRCRRVSHDW